MRFFNFFLNKFYILVALIIKERLDPIDNTDKSKT